MSQDVYRLINPAGNEMELPVRKEIGRAHV